MAPPAMPTGIDMFTINHPGNRVLVKLARPQQPALGRPADAVDPERKLLGEVTAPVPAPALAAPGLPGSAAPNWRVRTTSDDAGNTRIGMTPPDGPAGGGRLDEQIALGWCGPAEHGIPRVARQIADAARNLGFTGTVTHETDPRRLTDLVDRLPPATRLLHLHVNDWLFADAHSAADEAVTELVRRLAARGIRLSVTLHDVPQLSDGQALYRRRSTTYRLMAGSAAGVLVSSEHERVLLQEATHEQGRGPLTAESAERTPIGVIPLPIDPMDPAPQPARPTSLSVGIFGYLYPGKGHREVLEELGGMDSPVEVVAVGRASDRHTGLVGELTAVASRNGIDFRCTGYVPDSELARQLRRIGIPLAPHTHISASGSINSWIAAGRRPLVPAGRYVTELDQRLPGAVWIYQPGDLRRKIECAAAQPELTWLPTGLDVGPTTPIVAGRYLNWLRDLTSTLMSR